MLLPFWLPCRFYLLHPIFKSWHFKISLFQFSFFLGVCLLIPSFWVLTDTEGALAPCSFQGHLFPSGPAGAAAGESCLSAANASGLSLILIKTLSTTIITSPHVLNQGLSALVLWTFGWDNSLLCSHVSCLVGCSAVPLGPTDRRPEVSCCLPSPSHFSRHCYMSLGAKFYLIENHCPKGTLQVQIKSRKIKQDC